MTPPVKYGLYFFLTSAAITLIQFFVARESLFSPTMGFVTGIGLAIVFIILAIREDRGGEGGYTIAEGLKAGMICYGIGTFLGVIFAFILYNYIDPTLIDEGIAFSKEIAEKTASTMGNIMGASEAQKTEMMNELAKQEIANPFTAVKLGLGWAIGLVFPGLIIALITSAVMKRS
jgi:hypothetical protein